MEDGPPMFSQDNTCPDLLVKVESYKHHFVYGAITHYGRTSQSVPLQYLYLDYRAWSVFARRY